MTPEFRNAPITANSDSSRFRAQHATRLGQVTATDTVRGVSRSRPRQFRRFDSFALVYLLAGEGRYQDETGADCEINPGDMILVRPSLSHHYGPYAWTDWVERYIVFEGPIFELWDAIGLFDLHPPIVRLEPIHIWNTELDRLLGDTGRVGEAPGLDQIIRLQALLARILHRVPDSGELATEHREWLSRAYSLLDAGDPAIGNDLDLLAVAESMAISYDGFRKRFRKLSGVSPARYRTLQRIDRAQRLIQRGTMTNREIADVLGFCDEQHLSRRFRQITGKSPREFRQSLPLSATVVRED